MKTSLAELILDMEMVVLSSGSNTILPDGTQIIKRVNRPRKGGAMKTLTLVYKAGKLVKRSYL